MVLVALEAGLAAAVLYVAGVCIYRLYFHPLAKFPGPFLCRLTNWYPAIFMWQGCMLEKKAQWREEYGDIVRQGPNTLSFSSLSAMNQIYGVRSNVSKSEGYATMSVSRTPNLITAVDKSVHGFKRRIISQTMTEESLKSLEHRIVACIGKFVAMLGQDANDEDKGWSPPIPFRTRADWLTFDIMSDLTYGKTLGLLENPESRWLPGVFRKISQYTGTSLIQPNLFKYKVDRLLLAPRRKEIRETGRWLSKLASDRASLGNDAVEKDMFHAMLNAVDPKTNKSFTGKDLWTESFLLLFSGSDTTSSTMAAVIFYLTHNPEWLARATQEIRSMFSSDEDIILGPTLSGCNVLRACVDESQRLIPTAPNGPPRTADAGGITIDGHFLPEGTVVNCPIFHLQREAEYFKSPNDFEPDRWIINEDTAAEDEERIKHQTKAFMPFHVGPRSCTGWRLARMELEITIARILFLYDVKLAAEAPCCANTPAGDSCQLRMKAWMVATVEGPLVQFRPKSEGAA